MNFGWHVLDLKDKINSLLSLKIKIIKNISDEKLWGFMKYLKISAISFVLVTLDQITKFWAAENLSEPLNLIKWVTLQYQQNTGVAFSLPIPYFFLITSNFIILILIPFFAKKYLNLNNKIALTALILIITGALSNVFDRLLFGYVRDFISIGQWPVFNLADSFLTVGIFLILLFHDKILKDL